MEYVWHQSQTKPLLEINFITRSSQSSILHSTGCFYDIRKKASVAAAEVRSDAQLGHACKSDKCIYGNKLYVAVVAAAAAVVVVVVVVVVVDWLRFKSSYTRLADWLRVESSNLKNQDSS